MQINLNSTPGVMQIMPVDDSTEPVLHANINADPSTPGVVQANINFDPTTPGIIFVKLSAEFQAAVTLQVLSLSGSAFMVGDARGTIVGNVVGTTAGSMVAISSLSMSGALQLGYTSGVWQLQVGAGAPGSPLTLTFDLIEWIATGSNSPRTTSGFSVDVS
jgi:hypothetical protein